MLRDLDGQVLDRSGAWFIHHGRDVEMNWHGGDPVGRHTPNERFYVRNHSDPPLLDATSWRLTVHGEGVERPISLALDELKSMDQITVDRAVECTGNGRRLFEAQQGVRLPGTQWGLGAIGLARWTGVRLKDVLAVAGMRDSAVQVMPSGLDADYVDDGVDYGRVRRPLPLDKALSDDVLIAWAMNDQPLPRDHGFPARLVVPGWVGIASIKWLGDIEVQTTKVDSPWNTRWYRLQGEGFDATNSDLGRMPVKSMIDLPPDAELPRHRTISLAGWAWSGEAAIARVEVSDDDGATWGQARLVGANEPSCMTRWEFDWRCDVPGRHELLVRATDTDGRTQPREAAINQDGYLFGAVVRHSVTVN